MEIRERVDENLQSLDSLSRQEVRITVANVDLVDLTFNVPMALPFGLISNRPSSWVNISTISNGILYTGYGEGVTLPEPLFTDDSAHNIVKNSGELLSLLSSSDTTSYNELLGLINQHSFSDGGKYPTARLAVEMSILDLLAKTNQTSIRKMIGIPDDITEVPYGKSIGADSAVEMIKQTEDAIAVNATKIKIKVSPKTFSEVVSAITQIRQLFPNMDIMVDANGAFDPSDDADIDKISQLDKLGLIMIEEPTSRVGKVRGIEANYLLRQKLPNLLTPICLDDCLQTLDDCKKVVEDGIAQIINIKPGRLGSFLVCIDLIDWIKDNNAEVMVGGMFEATPGRCMTLLLGAYCLSKGFTIPGDLSLAQERLSSDLVIPEKQLKMSPDGNIKIPDGIGWGF